MQAVLNLYFNTSNVMVQQFIFNGELSTNIYFNTSNVMVQLRLGTKLCYYLSLFQYIKCDGSAINNNLIVA